jgi:hypothetical protein
MNAVGDTTAGAALRPAASIRRLPRGRRRRAPSGLSRASSGNRHPLEELLR